MSQEDTSVRRRPGPKLAAAAVVLVLAAGGVALASFSGRLRAHPSEPAGEDEVATEVPVHVAAVTRATLHRTLEVFGTVGPDAAHDGKPPAGAKLAAPVAGVLAKLLCSEGEHVAAGVPLFQLDARAAGAEVQKAASSVDASKATVARLKLAVDFAQGEYDRTKRLQSQGLASDKDVREADLKLGSAKQELAEANAKIAEAEQGLHATGVLRSLTTVRAPLTGTIVRIHVSPGEAVDAATVLADLVDLDRLVVAMAIPAEELHLVKLGQPVEIDGAPGGAGDAGAGALGAITSIGLDVDPKTGTAVVRSSVPAGSALRPGQALHARIVVEEHEGCLTVPEQSVVNVPGEGPVIAVIDGDTATQRPVEVGLREGGLVEIRADGLREGLTVAAAGAYGLPKQTKVHVIGERAGER